MNLLNYDSLEPIQSIRKNTFYDDGNIYCIGHDSAPGCYWLFDRDEKILRDLIHIVEEYGTLWFAGNKLRLPKMDDVSAGTALRQYLCSLYEGKPLSEIRTGIVMLRKQPTDTITDLTSSNVFFSKGYSLNNNKRIVERDGTLIKYHHKKDNVVDFFTYNDLLFWILSKNNITTGQVKGRTKAWIKKDWFYFHDLAFACYNGWINSVDTFLEDLKAFREYKHGQNLVTDHADSYKHNNTTFNLSLILKWLNDTKREYTAKFIYPYDLRCAYIYPGIYLMSLDILTEDGEELCRNSIDFNFESAERFVGAMKYLYCSKKAWCGKTTPRDNWRDNYPGTQWPDALSTEYAVHRQEQQVKAFLSQFNGLPIDFVRSC